MIVLGLGGVTRHGCVALMNERQVIGVCEQERITRVRGAGFNVSGLPDEAIDVLLQRSGLTRQDVNRYLVAELTGEKTHRHELEHVDHHYAHACAAYFSSPFSSAVVVVCDHEAPKVTVWEGRGADLRGIGWNWKGLGFADLYSRCAVAFGFSADAGDQRFEALARLRPTSRDNKVAAFIQMDDGELVVDAGFEGEIEEQVGAEHDPGSPKRAALAASVQARVGELFIELLDQVRSRSPLTHLCLAGSLFYHSSINTLAKQSGQFEDVFVPIDPGNAGLSVGTALHAVNGSPKLLSPFLGPVYSDQEIKDTLDNCKLQYTWHSGESAIATAVDALTRGRLVGWFDGGMEWGPRALGARCILANPFARHVLENLNRFLKHRESWRGYALSGLSDAVRQTFDGPASAPFMNCDYRPREPARFSHVLPDSAAAIRIQTVDANAPAKFRQLLEAFGNASGQPFLVNTSFNGFHEPIVCSPRDAIRVFYGSNLDLLVLGSFVVRK